jgi:hypothetical protein
VIATAGIIGMIGRIVFAATVEERYANYEREYED